MTQPLTLSLTIPTNPLTLTLTLNLAYIPTPTLKPSLTFKQTLGIVRTCQNVLTLRVE